MAERDDERINQFWDDLVARQPVGADPRVRPLLGLDPQLASAINHLHSTYAVSPPASTRDRVRQRVLEHDLLTSLEDVMSVDAAVLPLPYPNGRTAPERTSWLPELGSRRNRRGWALASLAAAFFIAACRHRRVPLLRGPH